MKKIINAVLVLLAIVAISACSNSPEPPEIVVEKFLNHLSKKEFEAAKAYATKETCEKISKMEGFASMGGENAEELDETVYADFASEIDDKANTAVVTYTADGKEEKFELVFMEATDSTAGRWLIHFPKEDSMSEAFDEAEQESEELVEKFDEAIDDATENLEEETDEVEE